ncbi:putative sh3 domain-containing protein [Rosellinia necatrix]|uniref:Putative sh3 domain-containing protein n=1 Tax=Rosellinia necatrix TaxID=77044 RepID=A0A1W2TU11_ROSNE|nr:putative sh3 domain-containing protein [Rosellinia necatrix]
MVTFDRQEIIANNKSLRLIKNELEQLLERGVITDNVFDSISRQLPAESSLSGAPTPASRTGASAVPPPPAPVNAMANLALHQNPSSGPAPPAYNATGPPALPARNNPPPPPPPTKPVIARARAVYKYQAADDRDLSFEKDDRVAVHEYMNDDWWMGRNERTGAEGIFPKNYVQIDHGEKAGYYAPAQPTYASPPPAGVNGGYPPPPQAQNPYNSHVPPMAVAQGSGGAPNQAEGGGSSKVNEAGKKFGKKLGNAAIFGAGATLGGNLVNSIF